MGRPREFDTDAVLAKALDVFWENGYGATSPARLAEAIGLGKGSLYHCFGSKRQLFDRVLDLYDAQGEELTKELLAKHGTAKGALRGYLRFLVESDLAGPVRRGCLAVNTANELAPHDEAARRKVKRMQDKTIAVIAERLAEGRAAGDVPAGLDVEAYAEYVMTVVGGLRVMARTSGKAVLFRVVDTSLHGI
ncbi:TetR/AcrR family transcriptional regulator [Salininema proteolyticum]|uniref:TetR/AcrR family transcriptional regulator n=1 Tax=Salininema proteolyticum TaxID=1607685 RepID=A0ABV8U3R1_9ACTN